MGAAFLPGAFLECDCILPEPSEVTIGPWPEGQGCEYDFWSPSLYEAEWSGQMSKPPGEAWAANWDEAVQKGLALQGPNPRILGDIGGEE
jgi:hypothetical protein